MLATASDEQCVGRVRRRDDPSLQEHVARTGSDFDGVFAGHDRHVVAVVVPSRDVDVRVGDTDVNTRHVAIVLTAEHQSRRPVPESGHTVDGQLGDFIRAADCDELIPDTTLEPESVHLALQFHLVVTGVDQLELGGGGEVDGERFAVDRHRHAVAADGCVRQAKERRRRRRRGRICRTRSTTARAATVAHIRAPKPRAMRRISSAPR